MNKKILREKSGSIVINHYNEEIVVHYPLETYLVQQWISTFFPVEYVKELSYFSLYLTSVFDHYKNNHSVLLVSDQSVSTMLYLKSHLLTNFSHTIKTIDLMPVYQYDHLKQQGLDYDILLTTNQKVLLNEADFFLIDPILNKKDKANIEMHFKQKVREIRKKKKANFLSNYYREATIAPADKRYEQLKRKIDQHKKTGKVYQTFSNINLYACSISESGATEITVSNLAKPITYDYKKISRIIDVHYNKTEDADVLTFFDTVSEILQTFK